jgi:hypothetical protein
VIRKRTAYRAEQHIRIKVPSSAPDTYKDGWRQYLLTIPEARRLLADLRLAVEGPFPESADE